MSVNYEISIPNEVKYTLNMLDKVLIPVALTIPIISVSDISVEKFLKESEKSRTSSAILPCPHLGFDLFVLRHHPHFSSTGNTQSSDMISTSSSTNPATKFRLFSIHIKPESVADNALLKEGDQIVEWMGEEITSVRQFYNGIFQCPILWLTLQRAETSFERQQRRRIEYLEAKLHLSRPHLPKSIFTTADTSYSASEDSVAIIGDKVIKSRDKHLSLTAQSSSAGSLVEVNSSKGLFLFTSKSKNNTNQAIPTPSTTHKKVEKVYSGSSSTTFTTLTSIQASPNRTKRKRCLSFPQDSNRLLNQIGKSTKQFSEEAKADDPSPRDYSIFTLPFDEKDLPRSWRMTKTEKKSCIEHVESGIKVFNSQQMNRVLQLLYHALPCHLSVQDAVKQSRDEYKEFKKRAAHSGIVSASQSAMTDSTETSSSLSNSVLHFKFDLQECPSGWLRYEDERNGNLGVYWKHCLSQCKVKDASIFPRVLQLLNQRFHGSDTTVKGAIRQAKNEKQNNLYTVELFDNKRPLSYDDYTTFSETDRIAVSKSIRSKYLGNDLPPTWKKEPKKSKKKGYNYVHIESGIKVHEPRLMPRILELLGQENNSLSVKEAISLAKKDM